jgi:Tol biopolymer transport system component
MAAAHAARIAHRDLKPQNIMLGSDGRVRILDFGLAKHSPVTSDPNETQAATRTQPGMILGTVNYMSPEQARGAPSDYRSDQFSFGLILYEMAAGKRAFDRPESVQTMSAIIGDDAPPLPSNVPAPLRWTIERCLAKDPCDRFESSRDLFQGLRSLRDHASEASGIQPAAPAAVAPPAPAQRRPPRWPVAAALLVGLAAPMAIHLVRAGPDMPDQSAYRFTPFSFAPGGQIAPVWAPDGKSVAYSAADANGTFQTFIRYLDAPTPVQITHTEEEARPVAWAPDGKRLLLNIDRKENALWSIAIVGGEPEVVIPSMPPSRVLAISPDNQSVGYFYPGDEGRYGVWISSPPTAAPKRYLPEPYTSNDIYNQPKMRFSPDGKQILLLLNGGRQREEAWLLPYPADPARPPRRVFANLQPSDGTPGFCWMPDSRHVVFSLALPGGDSLQLWLADTDTGEYHALTSGTANRISPAVSPDGQRIVFREDSGSYDIVAADLASAAIHPLIVTERDELMPAYAARKPLLAYVTNRNGPPEIWLHSTENGDRPLVTARDFPGSSVQWFLGPALSPEADRVVYTKLDLGGRDNRLWISAVAGGSPVPLTNDHATGESPGSWSLDGNWFAYIVFAGGKTNLMKVKTSGQATPMVVAADVSYDNNAVPVWSPSGDSILLGETLYAPDGKSSRSLGEHRSDGYAFAPDGQRLYGMRREGEDEMLFSVDVATGAESAIGKVGPDYRPRSNLNPATHFTLSPDGRSLVYGTGKFKQNLWMLEGFAQKKGLLARLGF